MHHLKTLYHAFNTHSHRSFSLSLSLSLPLSLSLSLTYRTISLFISLSPSLLSLLLYNTSFRPTHYFVFVCLPLLLSLTHADSSTRTCCSMGNSTAGRRWYIPAYVHIQSACFFFVIPKQQAAVVTISPIIFSSFKSSSNWFVVFWSWSFLLFSI